MRTLIMIAVAFVVLIPPAAADPWTAGSPPAPGDNKDYQTRSYDVSSLFYPISDFRNSMNYAMFPLAILQVEDEMETTTEYLDAGRIAEMISLFLGDRYFEHNGISVETRGTLLVVEGPPDFQDLVSRILGFLDATLNRQVSLKLELFSVSPDTLKEISGSPQPVPLNKDVTPLYARDFKMRLNDFWHMEDGFATSILYDHEPEIAQTSMVCEPISMDVFIGMQMAMRPMLAVDGKGLNIGLYGSFSSMDLPVGMRDAQFEGRIAIDEKIQLVNLASMINNPKISFASLGTTLLVTPDKPALAGIAVKHHEGLGSLLIRLSGSVEVAAKSLELGGGRHVECYDLACLASRSFMPFFTLAKENSNMSWSWSRFRLFDDYRSKLRNNYAYMHLNSHTFNVNTNNLGYYLFELESPRGDDDLCHALWGGEALEPVHDPEWCMAGTHFFITLNDTESDSGMSLVHQSGHQETETLPFDLYVIEKSGSFDDAGPKSLFQNSDLYGQFSLIMKPGSCHLGVAGFEGLQILGYDVDVATGTAVPNINTGTYFDGALVHVEHTPSTSFSKDSGVVETRVCLHQLTELFSTKDIGGYDDLLGIIDQNRFNRGYFTYEFPADGKLHLLGSLRGDWEDQDKTVFVLARAGR